MKKNPEIRASHILVAVPPNATDEAEKEARRRINDLLTKAKDEKTSFSDLAQKFSESMDAPVGGDTDFQPRERLDQAFYETALKLKKPGTISGIVRTAMGFHVIKLTAIRGWEDANKGKVKTILFEEKRKRIFDTYMADLRKRAKIQVNTALLKE